ncbi:MAG: Spx/MgsR family RNA polymerase-binding regulatory protein [Campylobacterales bacterium]
MIRVYGIPNCGSVKKGLEWLRSHGLMFEFIDLKKNPVDEDRIARWFKIGEGEKLLNTKGTKFRSLGVDAKVMSEAEMLSLIHKEQMVMKRPIIEWPDGSVTIGFNDALFASKLSA